MTTGGVTPRLMRYFDSLSDIGTGKNIETKSKYGRPIEDKGIILKIMKILSTKCTQKACSNMWRTDRGIERIVIEMGKDVYNVSIREDESGEFTTCISMYAFRSKEPIGRHCGYCREDFASSNVSHVNVCSLCEVARYCDESCQYMAWAVEHSSGCERIVKDEDRKDGINIKV